MIWWWRKQRKKDCEIKWVATVVELKTRIEPALCLRKIAIL